MNLVVRPSLSPPLDPDFVPASLWNRAYRAAVRASGAGRKLALAVRRSNGCVSVVHQEVFPHEGAFAALNERFCERLLKFLLWQRGGHEVTVAGDPAVARYLEGVYSPDGARAFDHAFMGDRVYGEPMSFRSVPYDRAPEPIEAGSALGRHLGGCRIGFDLGGSDRKCSAIIDGDVIHTEEIEWDPYFQDNPDYHFSGIQDILRRAAEKLPRVDAIGGSAAGVYVNNEVRVASLFRGVGPDLFEQRVRRMFFDLQKLWNDVPFVVVNDGEVTALAASMSLGANSVLGISMGTSQAGGYVTPDGKITDWLNELAFAPIDYRENAPVDEWSGDGGVGAQYFSQQAVARLLPLAGIAIPPGMPPARQLDHAQDLLAAGDERARRVFETIGVYLGYAVAHYADFYPLRHVLVLGRVTSGAAGDLLIGAARDVLAADFPDLADTVDLGIPDERHKRHGQAVAAASLPALAVGPGQGRVDTKPVWLSS
ncbi:MAG: ROK family protein [Candidatus Sericytochromatia bacterium]|nr:ROK family protein [Candidatus Tanganyikabacteria bacterium]